MCSGGARNMRFIVEECLKWVNQRKAFGKPLSSQPVIRSKLADMISRAETAQNWLESVTYQMEHMVREHRPQTCIGRVSKYFCHCRITNSRRNCSLVRSAF